MPLPPPTTAVRCLRALALGLLVLNASSSVPLRAATSTASHSTLLVYVEDAAAPLPISGASVRVLSEAGAVLTTAVTDESGEARIAKPPLALRPSLVLVEHSAFYIGGARWHPDADQICVHLAISRTCCRTIVTGR